MTQSDSALTRKVAVVSTDQTVANAKPVSALPGWVVRWAKIRTNEFGLVIARSKIRRVVERAGVHRVLFISDLLPGVPAARGVLVCASSSPATITITWAGLPAKDKGILQCQAEIKCLVSKTIPLDSNLLQTDPVTASAISSVVVRDSWDLLAARTSDHPTEWLLQDGGSDLRAVVEQVVKESGRRRGLDVWLIGAPSFETIASQALVRFGAETHLRVAGLDRGVTLVAATITNPICSTRTARALADSAREIVGAAHNGAARPWWGRRTFGPFQRGRVLLSGVPVLAGIVISLVKPYEVVLESLDKSMLAAINAGGYAGGLLIKRFLDSDGDRNDKRLAEQGMHDSTAISSADLGIWLAQAEIDLRAAHGKLLQASPDVDRDGIADIGTSIPLRRIRAARAIAISALPPAFLAVDSEAASQLAAFRWLAGGVKKLSQDMLIAGLTRESLAELDYCVQRSLEFLVEGRRGLLAAVPSH